MWVNLLRADGGRSTRVSLSPELDLRVASRFSSALSLNYSRNHSDRQFYGNISDNRRHGALHVRASRPDHGRAYPAAQLHRVTGHVDPGVRAAFDSKGTFANVREMSAAPRADRYDDRFQAYGDTTVTNNPGGFNYKQFASNVVFRWE